MSNVSIYEKNWIDLVFEGKNKEYGAYQLRNENSKTTLFSFFLGVVFFISVFGFGFLLASLGNETVTLPTIPIGPTIRPITLTEIPKVKPKQNQAPRQQSSSSEPKINSPLVVAETQEATKSVPTNTEVKDINSSSTENFDGIGIDINTPRTNENYTPTSVEKEPTPAVLLEKLPMFPGGMNKFYEYIGNNFERPTLDESTIITVLVSFVIEKDGSITDIKILRNPGYGMGNEAIRVLKSLKTKWSPGIMNGEKVRTLFTLPIKVKSE